MTISVTILTKNSEETLKSTLDSLISFPEVVILDTGSSDQTVAIGSRYPNVKIHRAPFTGFGELHNQAANLATHDWILSIDSDEVVTPSLRDEIQALQLDEQAVYSIERENHFNGKRMRCCAGWYPDWVIRLYNRNKTSCSLDKVHEKVKSEGFSLVYLSSKIQHTPYRSISQLLDKMQLYSTLFAKEHQGRKQSSFLQALIRGGAAFIKNYLFKRGILGGKEGFILSLYNAQCTYYKYLKLAELNKNICS